MCRRRTPNALPLHCIDEPDSLALIGFGSLFVEVAQRLNFRAAAKAVALTPAAVSGRTKQLEDQLGKAVFIRTRAPFS